MQVDFVLLGDAVEIQGMRCDAIVPVGALREAAAALERRADALPVRLDPLTPPAAVPGKKAEPGA